MHYGVDSSCVCPTDGGDGRVHVTGLTQQGEGRVPIANRLIVSLCVYQGVIE